MYVPTRGYACISGIVSYDAIRRETYRSSDRVVINMKRNLRFEKGDKVIYRGQVVWIHSIESGGNGYLDYGIRGLGRRYAFARDAWLTPLPALELLAECAE